MTDTVNVPREPTEAMIGNAIGTFMLNAPSSECVRQIYWAMIASAPKAEPVSDPYKFEDEVKWLREAARYFSSRDTKGEDRAYWANVYNAENANKIADRLVGLMSIQPEAPKVEQEPVAWMYRDADSKTWTVGKEKKWGDYAVADGGECKPLYPHPAPSSELLELVEDAEPIIQVLLEDRETAIGGECEVARDLLKRAQSAIAKHKGPQ